MRLDKQEEVIERLSKFQYRKRYEVTCDMVAYYTTEFKHRVSIPQAV